MTSQEIVQHLREIRTMHRECGMTDELWSMLEQFERQLKDEELCVLWSACNQDYGVFAQKETANSD